MRVISVVSCISDRFDLSITTQRMEVSSYDRDVASVEPMNESFNVE